MSINSKFMLMQSSTAASSAIDFKIALTSQEQLRNQDEQTDYAEIMQEREDEIETICSSRSSDCQREYNDLMAAISSDNSALYKGVQDAKKVLDAAIGNLTTHEAALKGVPDEERDTSVLEGLQEAKRLAEEKYKTAQETYAAKVEENKQKQTVATNAHQQDLQEINDLKKKSLNELTKEKNAKIKWYNKRDTRIKLQLDQLKTQKEMQNQLYDASKEGVSSDIQRFAPKF